MTVKHHESQQIQLQIKQEGRAAGTNPSGSDMSSITPSAMVADPTVVSVAHQAQEIISTATLLAEGVSLLIERAADLAFSAPVLLGITFFRDIQRAVEVAVDALEYVASEAATITKLVVGDHSSIIWQTADVAATAVVGCCEFAKMLVGIHIEDRPMQVIGQSADFMLTAAGGESESDGWNYVTTQYSDDIDVFSFCFAKEYPGFISYSAPANPLVLVNYTRDDLVVSVKVDVASEVLGFDPRKSKGLVKYDGHQDISTVLFIDAVDSHFTWEDTIIPSIMLGLDVDKKIVGLQVKQAAARVAETISEEDIEFYQDIAKHEIAGGIEL